MCLLIRHRILAGRPGSKRKLALFKQGLDSMFKKEKKGKKESPSGKTGFVHNTSIVHATKWT